MKTTALLLAGIASLSLASAASAATFFDGFEGDAPGLALTDLVNFDVTGAGSVDVVAPLTFDIIASSNVVDLDGGPGPGEITSENAFFFEANRFVDLSFLVGGSQRRGPGDTFYTSLVFGGPTVVSGFGGSGVFSGVTGPAGGVFLPGPTTFSTFVPGDMGFTASSLFFTSVSSGSLRFAFGTTSADFVGPLLDDVQLNGFASMAVPEPSTWAMMITGFGLAGAALRRRRTVAIRA